jgi:hypothetical protein
MYDTAVGWKNEDYAACLRNAKISLLPKYVQQNSSSLSLLDLALDNRGTEMLKRISLEFIVSEMNLIQCYSRIAPQQSPCHRKGYSGHF